jgi:conjugal transfer ATP-binding protein TraC
MGAFIEGFARRCRKEGGAIITGTQGINDYYKTSGANACLQNSDWQVFLRLKPEALEQARKDAKLSLDEAGMQLLKSLRTSTGEYSEAMIQGPNGRAVGRLVLDPFAGTLYSTTPAVYNAIEQLVGQGHSLQEAVRLVAFKAAPGRAETKAEGQAA